VYIFIESNLLSAFAWACPPAKACQAAARPPSLLCSSGATASVRTSGGWWAHQDSNLERAGYEPAALTVELWARYSLSLNLII
jgi:hypothetical protein